MSLELLANSFQTSLSGAITSNATTFTVANAPPTGLQTSGGQFRVLIDGEIMIVPATSSTSWSGVTRGAEGTTATAHASGATVAHIVTAGAMSRYAVSALPPSTLLPPNWDTQWQQQKALALAGSGTAKIASIGGSISAGQSSGTIFDCLKYGWIGRLMMNVLQPLLGVYAEGYAYQSVNPGVLTSPSSPYSTPASTIVADGGIGAVIGPTSTGSTWLTITVPQHPVSGAYATSVDLLTVDFNTNTWQYTLDGGSAVTITPSSWAGSGQAGLGNIRRTNIPLAGNVSHTINLQQNASNALRLIGHVAYYGTSGVGIMRAANGGWGACSYATGNASSGTNPGGGMGNTTSGNSLTTDHIQPWSGTYTFQVNNACTGFPFQPDLMILGLGPNDATDGSPPGMVRSAMERFINAARRGVPASSSTQLGASILILADPVPSMYGDSTLGGPLYAWHRYKELMRSIAQDYGCAYLDIGEVFGETSQTRGLIANSGQLGHPTQSNGASLGTDGHSLITQVVSGIL